MDNTGVYIKDEEVQWQAYESHSLANRSWAELVLMNLGEPLTGRHSRGFRNRYFR
jgi:hypothetical protein